MRNKDQILDDFILNDTRVVIAKNKQYHIIRYAPNHINDFYKKAKRIKHDSLRNCIEWLAQYFGVDLIDLSLKIKQSLNRPFKALKLTRPTDTHKRREAGWKNGGIKRDKQLDIFQ